MRINCNKDASVYGVTPAPYADAHNQHCPDAHVRKRCGCTHVHIPPSGVVLQPPASASGMYQVYGYDLLVAICEAHATIERERIRRRQEYQEC